MENERERLASLAVLAAEKRALKKAVCSKPADAGDVRTVLTLRRIGGQDCLQAETFRRDNKALHRNLPVAVTEELIALLAGYGQINLLTAAGTCELRCGKRGTVTLSGAENCKSCLTVCKKTQMQSPKTTGKSSTSCRGMSRFCACWTLATRPGG